MAFIVALCVAIPACAQTAPPTGAAATAPAAKPQQHNLYRGSKIIGSNVRDPNNRKIGQIKDLLLDAGRGEIAYVVVSFGGVLGTSNRYHAIPWQALDPSDEGNYYTLHADRETINQAPGFDKSRWPDMTDREWNAEIDRYWSRRVGRGRMGQDDLPSGGPGVSNPGMRNGTTGDSTR